MKFPVLGNSGRGRDEGSPVIRLEDIQEDLNYEVKVSNTGDRVGGAISVLAFVTSDVSISRHITRHRTKCISRHIARYVHIGARCPPEGIVWVPESLPGPRHVTEPRIFSRA